MKNEEFDQLPYTSRKELIELRKFCSDFLETNCDTIYKDDSDSVLHQFRDKTRKFSFNISNVKVNEAAGNNYYKVYYSPGTLTNNLGVTSQSNFEQIRLQINEWLGYIKKIHEVTEEYYDPFGKFYEAEFSTFFVNTDGDATTAPYDLDRQEILFYFLTYAETLILRSAELTDANKTELIGDIKLLKDSIPDLTKKEVVATLSKIAQKIKSFSNSLFHLVFDVFKKESVKHALYYTAERIPGLLKEASEWIRHLI